VASVGPVGVPSSGAPHPQRWWDNQGGAPTGHNHVSSDTHPDLAQIYAAYRGRVVAYAAKLIGRDDAEDVAQDVFVKVGRSLDTLSDPTKLTSWIHAITLNAVRDAARRRASRIDSLTDSPKPSDDEAEADDPLQRVPDGVARNPEEVLERGQMLACYIDFVQQLQPSYRDIYLLSEFEELADAEIAERLSLSLGTVKIRLHRARTKLFEQLRRNCQCYRNERGELMGRLKTPEAP
jgi:RNA polymerase sigma-70 factor (ECF subfamily)